MTDPLLGEIKMFSGNFAPAGYEFCNGQLLPIAQNSALFSILGTTYGGDGEMTFGLPDLRSRFPMHTGIGIPPNLTPRSLGQDGGLETVQLSISQMPSHNHSVAVTGQVNVAVSSQSANTEEGEGTVLAKTNSPLIYNDIGAMPGESLSGVTHNLSATQNNQGGSGAHENMPPFLCINYIIATTGIFPTE